MLSEIFDVEFLTKLDGQRVSQFSTNTRQADYQLVMVNPGECMKERGNDNSKFK